MNKAWALIGLVGLIVLFDKCNFTSQSYNTGKLLNPGETMVSLGVGKREFYSITSKDTLIAKVNEPPERVSLVGTNDTIRKQLYSVSLDYRLGVLRKLPFGKGLEIGFHLEGPYQINTNHTINLGPALLEFDGRFGFIDMPLGKGLLHHNIGLGWTIGPWIDNGWYAEYAIGWEYAWIIPYADFRAEWLSTNISDSDSLTNSYNPYTFEKRSWTTRTALGISMRLPHWWFLPDFVVPEISVIGPHYSAVSHFGLAYHVALRWLNGI
jgi:hypothetical protein